MRPAQRQLSVSGVGIYFDVSADQIPLTILRNMIRLIPAVHDRFGRVVTIIL